MLEDSFESSAVGRGRSERCFSAEFEFGKGHDEQLLVLASRDLVMKVHFDASKVNAVDHYCYFLLDLIVAQQGLRKKSFVFGAKHLS